MSPSQPDGVLRRLTAQKPIDEPGRKTISATHTVEHIQLTGRRIDCFSVHPSHRTPTVVVCGVHLPQRSRNNLDLWVACHHMLDHGKERTSVQLRTCTHLRPLEPKALLQILLIANQHVNV